MVYRIYEIYLQNERHIIMQVVCEASQCPETPVKVVAMQCLVRIMSLYYQFMEQYMSPALFPVCFLNFFLHTVFVSLWELTT